MFHCNWYNDATSAHSFCWFTNTLSQHRLVCYLYDDKRLPFHWEQRSVLQSSSNKVLVLKKTGISSYFWFSTLKFISVKYLMRVYFYWYVVAINICSDKIKVMYKCKVHCIVSLFLPHHRFYWHKFSSYLLYTNIIQAVSL